LACHQGKRQFEIKTKVLLIFSNKILQDLRYVK